MLNHEVTSKQLDQSYKEPSVGSKVKDIIIRSCKCIWTFGYMVNYAQSSLFEWK